MNIAFLLIGSLLFEALILSVTFDCAEGACWAFATFRSIVTRNFAKLAETFLIFVLDVRLFIVISVDKGIDTFPGTMQVENPIRKSNAFSWIVVIVSI